MHFTNTLKTQLILFFCCCVYLPGIYGPFIFDDQSSIVNNHLTHISELNTESLIASATSSKTGPLKRPIPMASFGLNYYFSGGLKPLPYKVTNIAIHFLTSLLLFFVILKILAIKTNKKEAEHNSAVILAGVISVLWALHPINLTSVLYIVQRMTSLSALFSLLSINLYLIARCRSSTSQPSKHKPLLYFFLSTLSWIAALYSKENSAIVPLLILSLEVFIIKDSALFNKLTKLRVLYKIIFILISIIGATYFFLYAQQDYSSRNFTMSERLLTESRIVSKYISLIVFPKINDFSLFHDNIILSTSITSPITTLLSIIFLSIISVIAFFLRHKNPLFTLGIAWFFIGHLLESTIYPLELMHEHRNYLPSVGIILSLVSLIKPGSLDNRKTQAVLLMIVLTLGFITTNRAYQWGSFQRLTYFEVKHNPTSAATLSLYSNVNHKIQQLDIAESAIKKAIALDNNEPTYPLHYQLMLTETKKSIPKELQLETLRRLEGQPITASTIGALNNIANCLKKEYCNPLIKNYNEWLDVLIKKHPQNSQLLFLQGQGLLASHDTILAMNSYQKAHEVDDNYLQPLFMIFSILIKNGQIDSAERVLSWAIEKNKSVDIRLDKNIQLLKDTLSKIKQEVRKEPHE